MKTNPAAPRKPLLLLWRLFRIVAVAYLVILGLMMWLEESFIYIPTRYPAPVGGWDPPLPAVEDAWFSAADGVKLHGWYLPHEQPRGVLLFAHGNAGNIAHRDDRLRNLHGRFALSVLIFDYRGYGRSEGSPNEAGILADARAARAWLAQRAGVPEREIILFGESLGGGVAVDLAAADGARGLILESTFTSLPDMAGVHYPWLPARWVMRNRLDSLHKIPRYRGPLLWSHGTDDEIIPFTNGQRLFAAANEPKLAVPLQGGRHNGPPHPEDYPTYVRAMNDFLDRLPPMAATHSRNAPAAPGASHPVP